MKTKIYFVQGVEGPHIAIGDIRVCGPKAWGGGQVVHQWEVDVKDIVNALNNIFNPAHQPLKSLKAETETFIGYIIPPASLDSKESCAVFKCDYYDGGNCQYKGIRKPCR